ISEVPDLQVILDLDDHRRIPDRLNFAHVTITSQGKRKSALKALDNRKFVFHFSNNYCLNLLWKIIRNFAAYYLPYSVSHWLHNFCCTYLKFDSNSIPAHFNVPSPTIFLAVRHNDPK